MCGKITVSKVTDPTTAEHIAVRGVVWYAEHGYFTGEVGSAVSTLLRLWRTRQVVLLSAEIDGELVGAMAAGRALSHFGAPILQQLHVAAWCNGQRAQVRVIQALHTGMREVAATLGCVECVSCSALDTAPQFQRMLLKIGWEPLAPRSLASCAPASPVTAVLGARGRPRRAG